MLGKCILWPWDNGGEIWVWVFPGNRDLALCFREVSKCFKACGREAPRCSLEPRTPDARLLN